VRARAWLAAGLLAAPGSAAATWSIAAVDPVTREVGVAGASCIGGVEVIVGLMPGHGAVAAQAFSHRGGRDLALARLGEDTRPAAIVAELAGDDFDAPLFFPLHRLRQYGVVALGHDAPATYTGRWTVGWAGARTGHGVAAQGNMLRGPEVVDAALAAFEAARDCALPARLLLALEAGGARGGDRRCAREQAALSAVLGVAAPGERPGAPGLWLVVPEQKRGGANPIALLRAEFDARAQATACAARVPVP
jgi:uncharacterized Ntn-hydrolase superfamily protein